METIIVGGGGLGREVYSYLLDELKNASNPKVIRFLDDNPNALEGYERIQVPIAPVHGHQVRDDCEYVIAIGDPATRKSVIKSLGDRVCFHRLVHRTAVVDPTALLGKGCVIGPHCFVGPDAVISDHVFLNVRSTIGHDARVGDYVTLSPHCAIGGGTTICDGCFLGTGSIVNPYRKLGEWSRVSSGTTVDRNIESGSLVAAARAKNRVMFRT